MPDAAVSGGPGGPVDGEVAGRPSSDGGLGGPGPVGPQAAAAARRRASGDEYRDHAKQRSRSS